MSFEIFAAPVSSGDRVLICVDRPNPKGKGYSPEVVQEQLVITIEVALRLQGMLAVAIQTAVDRRLMQSYDEVRNLRKQVADLTSDNMEATK